MGLNPADLEGYTPRELDALLRYIDAKLDSMKRATS